MTRTREWSPNPFFSSYRVYIIKAMRIFSYTLAITCLLLGAVQIAHAQNPLQSIQENLSIVASPEAPGPNESVQIMVRSHSYDLNQSEVVWSVNGAVVERGIGIDEINIITGDVGQRTLVTVQVAPPNRSPFSQSISIIPQEIDVIWESGGYIPAFYEGKSLYSTENPLTFWAVPNFRRADGSLIPKTSLVYRWFMNGKVLGNSSGLGKDTVKLLGSAFVSQEKIKVEVSTTDGSSKAIKEIAVSPVEPLVVLYQNHPLYGTEYQTALTGTFDLEESEISIEATPFYFGIDRVGDPTLKYNWKMNGQAINTGAGTGMITLRPEGNGGGVSQISLEIKNVEEVMQSARNSFNVRFGI